MSMLELDEFKDKQRKAWGSGEYSDLSRYIADVGERVVAAAGIRPAMDVLDVACGTGNAAVPAARAGASVIGVDLVPKFLDQGRAKAEAQGLNIEWREADAENLPFEDHRFDRVLSTFGHMFAPQHQRTAQEMARVCRPGGAIVTATWTPEGVTGDLFEISSSFMPPPPDYASPPILWGREEYVRERFAGTAVSVEFRRHVNWIEWDSIEGWAEFFMTRFPMMVTAQAMLGDRFGELRAKIVEVWTNANEATDGSLRLRQEYLLSIIWL